MPPIEPFIKGLIQPPPWNTKEHWDLTTAYIEVMKALYSYGYDIFKVSK